MSELKFRLRWNGGNTLISLTSANTIKDLKFEIKSKTSIPPHYQEILKGYPPEKLLYQNSCLLSSTSLTSGETIIVEKLEKPQMTPDNLCLMKMFRRIIASDNSCLFNAIAYAIETKNKNSGGFLRSAVSAVIESDPETYNEIVLGKPNSEYCRWIELNNSWGGAIELLVISQYYSIKIAAVSIQNSRVDVFGQDSGYEKIIYVIYDGIHYDVLVKNFDETCPEQDDHTVFDANNQDIYNEAVQVARELCQSRQFTDVSNFTILCATCNTGLVGEKEMMQHAQATGHSNFQEYKKQ